jgi:hypothetical protein
MVTVIRIIPTVAVIRIVKAVAFPSTFDKDLLRTFV